MSQTLKLISWNVNGIRAALNKGFLDYVKKEDPDIICIQETKAQPGQAVIDLPNYTEYWNSAVRKGYSGTAILTKELPLSVTNNIVENGEVISIEDKYGNANTEGRVLTAEYKNFFIVTVYTPNSKGDLSRLEFRHKQWDVIFLKYIKELEKKKPVIFCGDLNVAHKEIDLTYPKQNENSHGFTKEEREGFDNIVKSGFIDTLRHFQPDTPNLYTWWSPFGNSRTKNVGWRIDYFCISNSLKNNLKDAFIRAEVMGSDHAPIGIELEI